MLRRLIKQYTPFICAIISAIHGVMFLCKVGSVEAFQTMGNTSGYSLILLAYVWAHSKKMCKWYKSSIIMLALVNVLNIMYYNTSFVALWLVLYGGLILNIASMMCWLIFITIRTISKTVCSAHTDLEEQE